MAEQQHQLFESEPEPWELDDAEQKLTATVVMAVPDGRFDYLVPDALAGQVVAGQRVQAPLGKSNRPATGYCVAVETRRTRRKLKSLTRVLDRRPLLSPAMLRLTKWMADYYLCSWGRVLEAVVPAGVRANAGTRNATLLSLPPEVAGKLDALQVSEKQLNALKALAASTRPLTAAQLAKQAGCTTAPINALRSKGLIAARQERVNNFQPQHATIQRESNLELNSDQHRALAAIRTSLHSREHRTILVHGVTGSGKTEVYIQAIGDVVSFGRQSILLVPEISLTPQTCERFRRRFDRIAVLHSHLSDAERAWHWEEIAAGRVQVVIGARSAIFAPTPQLGLILIDEEHETSFKQGETPRYHARDVAIERARAEGVPLVLGSATPSLESWHAASQGRYELVEMPRRALDRPLPAVATVDLRGEALERVQQGAISRQLRRAMETALSGGGQVILLLNRRGFFTHIQCPACGLVLTCPHCDLALTHHRHEEIALCHYCDFRQPAPLNCPECQAPGIRYRGRGTQKLEAEVRSLFPSAACLRMDTDSMQRPGSHEQALAAFRRGDVQILLGTQMIAKGLDFPNVTLVGVINADTALHLPDFRAAERTFHLVTQVAGRTGRGEKGGRVLVQTCSPDHPAIMAAVRHDYGRFAEGELPFRQALGYPPYSTMIRLVIRGPVAAAAHDFALRLGERISAAGESLRRELTQPADVEAPPRDALRVLGPAPAPFARLRGNFRFQIQVQSPDGAMARAAVAQAARDLTAPEGIQWIADVDPVEML